MVAERSRPSPRSPSTEKWTIASSTVTAAIVRSSRCGFVTRIRISPGLNSTRRTSNRSAAGGLRPISLTSESPLVTNTPTVAASRRTGTSAHTRHQPLIDHLEKAHPAELSELGLVRVEHEATGVREVDLDDPALAL